MITNENDKPIFQPLISQNICATQTKQEEMTQTSTLTLKCILYHICDAVINFYFK